MDCNYGHESGSEDEDENESKNVATVNTKKNVPMDGQLDSAGKMVFSETRFVGKCLKVE